MITKQELEAIGFLEYGQKDNDIFYKIVFTGKLKFNVYSLAGNLKNGVFLLYENNEKYNDVEKLKLLLLVVGGEIIYKRKNYEYI